MSKLYEIRKRLAKAYSLPVEEQKEFQWKILELEKQARALSGFDDVEAVRKLIRVNRELAMILAEKRYNNKFGKFLNENKKVSEKFDNSMLDLDKNYGLADWNKFSDSVSKYKETVIEIMKLFAQASETGGFRELIDSEAVENPFLKVSTQSD